MRKISIVLCVLTLMLTSFTASAENVRGDVDQDGRVTIGDVTVLIDYLLTDDASGISLVNADCDFDGRISIADMTRLIDNLLTGSWGDEPVTPDEHEWVDLGLPSGTLWATCNIGADTPEGYGDFFAWGETEPKDYYVWNTYKWCNGSYNTMTKYCTNSYGYNGFTDGKTELDTEDDAAWVNWGASWRMPTLEQHLELIDNCTWTWKTQNSIKGYLVTGQNGNSIFLPAAGSSSGDVGFCGYYWSRTLDSGKSNRAFNLYFSSGNVEWNDEIGRYRYYGYAVRAVRMPQN